MLQTNIILCDWYEKWDKNFNINLGVIIMRCVGCDKKILPNSKRCVFCERPDGVIKSEGEEYVIIHRKCLMKILKQLYDAMTGLNEIRNFASDKYAKVYNQYRD